MNNMVFDELHHNVSVSEYILVVGALGNTGTGTILSKKALTSICSFEAMAPGNYMKRTNDHLGLMCFESFLKQIDKHTRYLELPSALLCFVFFDTFSASL